MKSLTLTLVLTALITLALPTQVPAQEELTPEVIEKLVSQLKLLSDQTSERKRGKHSTALAAFSEAASSNAKAYEFFVECTKLINFDQQEKRNSEYRDWKSRTKELKSVDHCAVLRFQLNWLIMTIAADNSKDIGELIPKIYSALNVIVVQRENFGRYHNVLNGPVTSTIFARAYGLDSGLSSVKSWEMNPMNITGVFEKTVMPYFRATEDVDGLMGAWDLRIKLASELALDRQLEQAKIDFSKETLPRLRWQKMRDLYQLGSHASAATKMVEIIQTNIAHDDCEKWINELKGLLEDTLSPPAEE